MTLADLDLTAILATVIAEHTGLVAAWLRDEPGSWGALAAQAILAAAVRSVAASQIPNGGSSGKRSGITSPRSARDQITFSSDELAP